MSGRWTRLVFLTLVLSSDSCRRPVQPKAPAAPPEPENVFVLLADPDGRVGRIIVSNTGGSQELDRADMATLAVNSATAPGTPFQMSPDQVSKIFAEALAAQPQPPVHFLLYFDTDSSRPTRESLKQVPEILRVIGERKSNDISVVGHTDATGQREYNTRLSLARAQATAKLLVDAGVDPDALEITSHGKDNPLVPTPDNTPEPKNRRVEITVR